MSLTPDFPSSLKTMFSGFISQWIIFFFLRNFLLCGEKSKLAEFELKFSWSHQVLVPHNFVPLSSCTNLNSTFQSQYTKFIRIYTTCPLNSKSPFISIIFLLTDECSRTIFIIFISSLNCSYNSSLSLRIFKAKVFLFLWSYTSRTFPKAPEPNILII